MPDREYYKRELHIWNELLIRAASGIPGLYKAWKLKGSIESFIMSWPSESILDDNGVLLEGTVMLELPKDKAEWSSTLLAFVKRTKAYALLLTEQLENEVRVILESHHGTRSWTLPIWVSGDIKTLGSVVVKDDTHRIGILWGSQQRASG